MKNLLSVLVFVALLSPFATFADDACVVHTDAITHQEYQYQEQIDIDPRGGFEFWQNVGAPTAWTASTTVEGHAPDAKFEEGRIIKVSHRWHVADTRTVTDTEASDAPCEGSGSSSSQTSTSGGGGMCNPNTGYPECQGAANFRYFGLTGGTVVVPNNNEQIKVLLNQVLSLLLQQIQYLKTH